MGNTALVVDDSVMDRRRAGGLIEKEGDWHAVYAEDGPAALAKIAESVPDVVITDLTMPGMTGLELVEAIRRDHPDLPVIIMTSMGSEDIAVEALRQGAASYVPKRRLAGDLLNTVRSVAADSRDSRGTAGLQPCLRKQTLSYSLPPDLTLVLALAGSLQQTLSEIWDCPKRELINIGIALEEALVNAYYHGCLEVGRDLRDSDHAAWTNMVEDRRQSAPWCDRRIHLEAAISPQRCTFVVVDEGPGFDPAQLPDPTDPAHLESELGRGLVLISTFMDSVTHNSRGNELTMVKHRPRRRPTPAGQPGRN
ncbi:MAG: response regulator [Planctomycetaceae bacterium]